MTDLRFSKERLDKSGYIYMFTDDRVIKVGYSYNLDYRMSQHRATFKKIEMIRLVKVRDCEVLEKAIHQRLKPYRTNGGFLYHGPKECYRPEHLQLVNGCINEALQWFVESYGAVIEEDTTFTGKETAPIGEEGAALR